MIGWSTWWLTIRHNRRTGWGCQVETRIWRTRWNVRQGGGHHHKPRSKIAKALAFLLTIDVKRGHITSTARKFKISRRTLSNAWHKVQEVRQSHSLDSNDREVIRALHLTEPRGATSHRLLSDDQEALVVNKLRQDYPRIQ